MFDWLDGIAPRLGIGTRPAINASTWRMVSRIESLAPEMESLNDLALKRLGRSLSYRARAGEPADSLLIESFAATREAGRRRLGMRHYDVQLLAGIALVHGAIVEMGGHGVGTERQSRVSEAAVRGFWQQWRGLMGF